MMKNNLVEKKIDYLRNAVPRNGKVTARTLIKENRASFEQKQKGISKNPVGF
jgi:hypothetical protein